MIVNNHQLRNSNVNEQHEVFAAHQYRTQHINIASAKPQM
jgi:hypothetical protein